MANATSIEQALARCLGEMARTGDVEASLRPYPQYTDHLRPLLEVAQAAHRYYTAVPEAPGGLKAGRDRLLTAAAQQRAQRRAVDTVPSRSARQLGYRRVGLAFAMRMASALLAVVIGVAVIGSGVVWAASDDLPGDLLYPVKIVVEDARLALASAPPDQVDLALWFLEERVEEIQKLVNAERQGADAVIARMERHLERALEQAAWTSDEKMEGVLRRIATRTRTQAEILTLERELRESTDSQQVQAVLERAATICLQGAEAAEYGLREPQVFRSYYRYHGGIVKPTERPRELTVTPGGEQNGEPERHQWRTQERDGTATGTPYMTPAVTQTMPGPKGTLRVPQATARPGITPEGPESTLGPRSTPQGPQATAEPQPTTGAQATPGPQVTRTRPQATPVAPQATPKSQDTREKPEATPEQQPTPSDPQETREPQPTSQQSQATPKPQTTPRGK
jgi:hypothetical protein